MCDPSHDDDVGDPNHGHDDATTRKRSTNASCKLHVILTTILTYGKRTNCRP